MTTTTTVGPATGLIARLMRRGPSLALLLAIVALILLAIGPAGWRAGWWHYRAAFQQLMPWAAYLGIAAMGVAALSLALGWRSVAGRRAAIGLVALMVGGGVAYMPWHYNQMRGTFPPINDISTDTDNPPAFIAAIALRKAENANSADYGGAKVAEQQRRAYPDIAPVTLQASAGDAYKRALAAARRLGWTVTADDPAAGRIEAFDRSRWFGFTDDVVIRVVAAGTGSRIDVRSSSRAGRGDFGVNASRVRRYIAELRGGI